MYLKTSITHLLGAEDLILSSYTEKGIQKQLDGFKKFCEKKMIINETKTKIMFLGKSICSAYFNQASIKQVTQCEYLGNIVRSVRNDKITFI